MRRVRVAIRSGMELLMEYLEKAVLEAWGFSKFNARPCEPTDLLQLAHSYFARSVLLNSVDKAICRYTWLGCRVDLTNMDGLKRPSAELGTK